MFKRASKSRLILITSGQQLDFDVLANVLHFVCKQRRILEVGSACRALYRAAVIEALSRGVILRDACLLQPFLGFLTRNLDAERELRVLRTLAFSFNDIQARYDEILLVAHILQRCRFLQALTLSARLLDASPSIGGALATLEHLQHMDFEIGRAHV